VVCGGLPRRWAPGPALSGGLWCSASAEGARIGAERRHGGRSAGDVEVSVATGDLKNVGVRGAAGAAVPGMERTEGQEPLEEGRAEMWLKDEETARSRRNHTTSGMHLR
jgi:hypothetical protein